MPEISGTQQIANAFRNTRVMQMSEIERAVAPPRSRRSLFRDLTALGYLSSYTHTGRYYTLASIPVFDVDGLWRYEGIGFSRDGTLKATVQRLVETSAAGRSQHELQLRLGTRVHNPLLDLVESKRLGRESIDDEFVYVAAKKARAKAQLECRRALLVAGEAARPTPTLELEVLIEVIHGARVPPPDAAMLTARLGARGVPSSVAEVEAVLERHGLEKKLLRLARDARGVEADSSSDRARCRLAAASDPWRARGRRSHGAVLRLRRRAARPQDDTEGGA